MFESSEALASVCASHELELRSSQAAVENKLAKLSLGCSSPIVLQDLQKPFKPSGIKISMRNKF